MAKSRNGAAYAAETSYIDPERIYTLEGFTRASGISRSRIREARLAGIKMRRLMVGKRILIRGRDAIAFIEAIAEEVEH